MIACNGQQASFYFTNRPFVAAEKLQGSFSLFSKELPNGCGEVSLGLMRKAFKRRESAAEGRCAGSSCRVPGGV